MNPASLGLLLSVVPTKAISELAVVGAEEPAHVEAGPVDRRHDGRRRRLEHALADRRCGQRREEVVTQARIGGPTFEIVAGAIIAAHEPDPAGIGDLAGDARRDLAVGADTRGAGGDIGLRGGIEAGGIGTEEEAIRTRRERRGGVVGKLAEHARGHEWLQHQVAGCERGPHPQAETPDQAFDVVESQRSRDHAARSPSEIDRIDLGVRPHDTARRLDEPVVAELELISGRGAERVALRVELLTVEIVERAVQVDVVELRAEHDIGEEVPVGRDQVGAGERDLDVGLERHDPELLLAAQFQVAGRGADVDVPAAHVEPRHVRADLDAAEGLALDAVAGGLLVDREGSAGGTRGTGGGEDSTARSSRSQPGRPDHAPKRRRPVGLGPRRPDWRRTRCLAE